MQARDVFISHRGPDTKSILVNLLADQLKGVGITVFYDKGNLDPAADQTAWNIIKAQLRAAKIQVVCVHVCFLSLIQGLLLMALTPFEFFWQIAVFSEHYLDSKWCKEELLIMNETPDKIMPIFYGVSTIGYGAASGKSGFVYNRESG